MKVITYRFFIFVLFYMTLAPVAIAFVMGPDNREEITGAESVEPAIRQVGVIMVADGSFVSGLVTGRNCDVVITAGHAVFHAEDSFNGQRRKGELRGNGIFRFYPEPGTNTYIDMNLVRSGFQKSSQVGNDQHDWSIFRLDKPAYRQCSEINIAGSGTSCAGQILMPAIHYDRRNTRLIDRSCAIKDMLGKRIIVHNCDSKDGSSGAPILCKSNDHMTMLGINISGVRTRELVDPGEYGQHSRRFNHRNHKNFALNISGKFLQALNDELRKSRDRKRLQDSSQ